MSDKTIQHQKIWLRRPSALSRVKRRGVESRQLHDRAVRIEAWDNLYKIWHHMPRELLSPPQDGCLRRRVAGRILRQSLPFRRIVAQTVPKSSLTDSGAYLLRTPRLSAEEIRAGAVAITRKRCWKYDWVLEFDIKALFDNIEHGLLLKALDKHTDCKWVRLYIERWLTAPLQHKDGTLVQRTRGHLNPALSARCWPISSCFSFNALIVPDTKVLRRAGRAHILDGERGENGSNAPTPVPRTAPRAAFFCTPLLRLNGRLFRRRPAW